METKVPIMMMMIGIVFVINITPITLDGHTSRRHSFYDIHYYSIASGLLSLCNTEANLYNDDTGR